MKRIISLLLILLMIAGIMVVVPVGATGIIEEDYSEHISQDGKYKYKFRYEDYEIDYEQDVDGIIDGWETVLVGVSIVDYIGEEPLEGRYVVPDEIDGYKVKAILSNAFEGEKFSKVVFKQYHSWLYIGEKAFYNCKKLKNVYISQYNWIDEKAFGYYYDKKTKKDKKVEGFTFRVREEIGDDDSADYNLSDYAYDNEFKEVFYLDSSQRYYSGPDLSSGKEFYIKVDGKSVKGWKSTDKKIINISDNGKVRILDKGKATIKVRLSDNSIFKLQFDGKYVGGISIHDYEGEFEYHKGDTVIVNKGKTVTLYLGGKVHSIKNVYTNSPKAKFVNTRYNDLLKIKGLKKGKTTLKVKLNGVRTIKVKVQVK